MLIASSTLGFSRFLALPALTQQQLGSCFGAFGLHLAARFDAARRAMGWLQGPLVQGPRAGLGGDAAAATAEPECAWFLERTEELQLPAFPELGGFDLTLPPIPRLLPTWQQLQQLQALQPGQESQVSRSQPTAAAVHAPSAAIGVQGFSQQKDGRKCAFGEPKQSERRLGQNDRWAGCAAHLAKRSVACSVGCGKHQHRLCLRKHGDSVRAQQREPHVGTWCIS